MQRGAYRGAVFYWVGMQDVVTDAEKELRGLGK